MGAAVQVEEGDNDADPEAPDNADDDGGTKSMTTRSGRKRSATTRLY